MSDVTVTDGAAADATSSSSDAAVPVLLECRNLAKSFGPTRAVVDASMTVRSGEVHSVLGENGSGKSTFVKMVSGIREPDSGSIEFTPLDRTTSAAHRGIATVFQEVLVVASQSVLENVWLGVDGVFRTTPSASEKRRIADALLQRLCGRKLQLDAPVGTLSLSDQQACCIARALVREPDLLILDEATSALDLSTRDRFFEILREMCAEGMGAIFISHRMDELLDISDRITVMRSGRTVDLVDREEATVDGLVRSMTGGSHDTQLELLQREERAGSEPLLHVDEVVLAVGAAPIDLEIRAGEIVGIAGLEGHGQEDLLLAMWGHGAISGRVRRVREGKAEVALRSPRHAARNGVAYVPRDRRRASIFPTLSILENFAMTTLGADSVLGVVRPKARRQRFQQYRDALAIKLGNPNDGITTLSGGNQQKVILSRWLATGPDVLLLNDPTRGIDLGAKNDIYRLLRKVTEEGAAVVMLSSELEEHLNVMDRVVVMRENAVSAEFDAADVTRERLVSAFFGMNEEVSP